MDTLCAHRKHFDVSLTLLRDTTTIGKVGDKSENLYKINMRRTPQDDWFKLTNNGPKKQ